MIKRIIFDLVLLAAVFYTPWWVVVPLVFFGAFYFPSYYEIFVAAVMTDLLYGASSTMLYGIASVVGAIVLYFLAQQAKKLVRPTYK